MDDLSKVFEAASAYFGLLAEPMRIRVLHAICHRERTVNEIVQEVGATQANVSRHLALMYRAGVLSRRKDGNHVWYAVSDPVLTEICRTVCVHVVARTDPASPMPRHALGLARDLAPPRTRRAAAAGTRA